MSDTVEGKVVDLETVTSEGYEPTDRGDEPAPLPLKEATARFAKIDAFASAVSNYVQRERPLLFARLMEAAEETDSKSFNVKNDGETVATMTITEPKDKTVVSDEDALVDYVMENYPSEVETITRVRPSFEKVLLKKVKAEDVTPEATEDEPEPEQVWMVIDPDTGEEVPGLKHIPAAAPSSFSTRWKSQDKKDDLLDGLLAGVAGQLGIEAGDVK